MDPSGITAPCEAQSPPRTGNKRRAVVCACAVGFAFSASYTNHAPLVSTLMREFGFNQALAGLLTTGIFLTHAAMQVPGGHLVDRLGSARVLVAALAVVLSGNFAIALATAYWQLLFWKVFVGVGTGTCFVAGARYITEALAGADLHLAQGLYGGSILLGSGFVILEVPKLLPLVGWRGAFVVTSVVAAAAWLAWIALAPRVSAASLPPGSFRGMLGDSQLWILGWLQMASFGLAIVVGAWIVTLLVRSFGMPLAQAGLIGSLVLLLGILMRPLGGALAPRIGVARLARVSLFLNALGCWMLGATRPSLAVATLAILLLGAGCGLPYAALFTRAAALFPGRAGAAMGLVNALGILMILVGAPLVGHLADWTGSFRSSFLALGAFSLLASGATFLLREHEPAGSV